VFVVALLFVVFCARVASARIDVDAAASAAARAASMSPTVAAAAAAANSTAADNLAGQSITCLDLSVPVDTSQFHRGGSVSVTVVCTVQLSDLGVTGIGGSRTLSSTATAPVDLYRHISLGVTKIGGLPAGRTAQRNESGSSA
jgi:hypothetical protein